MDEGSEVLQKVDDQITQRIREERETLQHELDNKLGAAQAKLDQRNYSGALEHFMRLYDEQTEDYLRERIDTRIRVAIEQIQQQAVAVRDFADRYEDPDTDREVIQTYPVMSQMFRPAYRTEIGNLQALAAVALKKASTPDMVTAYQGLKKALDSWESTHDSMTQKLGDLQTRYARLAELEQLSDQFLEASIAAENAEFQQALELYRQVLHEYGDGELRSLLEEREAEVAGILDEIRSVEGALKHGNVIGCSCHGQKAAGTGHQLAHPSRGLFARPRYVHADRCDRPAQWHDTRQNAADHPNPVRQCLVAARHGERLCHRSHERGQANRGQRPHRVA